MSPMVSYIRKITYATETIELLPSRVPNPVGNNAKMGSTGNGNTFLYVIGGSDGSGSEAKKLTYASDSVSNIPNMPTPGSLNRAQKAGCASSTEAAYIVGGSNPYNNRIDKITFSNDTCSYASMNSTVPTPAGRMQVAGTGLPSAGYFAGGTETSIVEKITYSTNSIARIPALDLTSGVSGAAGFGAKGDNHESPVATRWKDGFKEDDLKVGYYQGGGNPSSNSATQKVSFVTDEASLVPGGSLPQNGSMFAGVNSNSVKAILSGGEPGGEAFMKFVYNTETSSNLAGAMPSRRTLNNDMGYGTESLGYVTGGMSEPSNPGFYYSSTQKIEYATDTTSDVPGANANQDLRERSAYGNVDHTLGYIVGGITKSPHSAESRIQKMTYSTETISNTPTTLATGYFQIGTASGPDAGFLYSKQQYPGYGANGAVDKIVYATDTRTHVASPPDSYGAGGTGNSTNGYYGGGAPNRYTRILKLNFSTSSTSTLPSSFSLPSGVYRSAASSAVARKKSPKGEPVPTPTSKAPGPAFNGAIWMGGYNALTNQYTSSGGKIDFSTDVITNLPSTQLTKQSYDLAATSSLLAGYYAQGAPSNTSIVKVDYATSSPSTLTSNLSGGPGAGGNDPRRRGASFGLKTAGYFMQGDTGSSGNLSNLDKITYSSDTSARLPGSNTTTGAYATVGASNQTNGYQTGGTPGGGTMRKMPFATESWGYAPNANFPAMWDAKSMSNATHGYFIGPSGNNANGTRVYKLTFATDSASQLPTNFPQYSRYGWGTGNSTHGYASGGVNTGSITTRIYKLQYSNDTWSTTPNRIQGGAIQQNAAASARQNGNGNTVDNVTPNVV